MEVEARYDLTTKVAFDLNARAEHESTAQSSGSAEAHSEASVEAKAEGTVSSVDSASGKLVVSLKNGQSLDVHADSNTKIVVNGEAASLADIQAGAEVHVEYDAQGMVAYSIEAEFEAQAEASSSASITGELKSVNLLSGTVMVVAEDGSEVVLDVASDTEVLVQGQAVFGLTALVAKVGAQVEIEFNAETNVASKIEF
jgi:hypothetical protein